MQVRDPIVALLDRAADRLGRRAETSASSSTAAVSRSSPYDHRAITIEPTIPMTGSIQLQPSVLPARSATMANTEVIASASTWRYAARRLWSRWPWACADVVIVVVVSWSPSSCRRDGVVVVARPVSVPVLLVPQQERAEEVHGEPHAGDEDRLVETNRDRRREPGGALPQTSSAMTASPTALANPPSAPTLPVPNV